MSSRNAPTTGPTRPPMRSSHLRQFSRASLDRLDLPQSPDTVSSNNSTIRDCPPSRRARVERRWTVTVNESFVRDEVLLNLDVIGDHVKPGTLFAIDVVKPDPEKQSQTSLNKSARDGGQQRSATAARPAESESRYICVAKDVPKEIKTRYPNVEVYVAKHVADAFGMRRGSQVILTPIDDNNPAIEASHVELSFKDQYLSRADMWRLARGDMCQKTVYKGQLLFFMGTIKAQVTTVYVDGRKVHSAFFGRDTKPIFRSDSARYVLFIQMAREMWDFDSDGSGELIFNKVVNGFLPALFKKWAALKVKHLVTIVLFSRVEYDTGILTDLAGTAAHNDYYTGTQSSGDRRPYKDFYRVVVSEMASGEWTKILYQLKREFNYFRKDISTYHLKAMAPLSPAADDSADGANALNRIKAEASKAMYGNFLEAINMASSLFSHDYIDRDLMRTGISVAVISASPGVFEVEYETLRRTTEALVGNGIGIDLICVPKIPLHSVPLFRYRKPRSLDPLQNKGKPTLSLGTTPKQTASGFGSYNSLSSSFSPSKWANLATRSDLLASDPSSDEWVYALPQWLHVSYWSGSSGSSEGALLYQGIALSVPEDQSKDGEEFPIRCRMYDLQMRSVMETNGIETKPLHLDPHFPLKAVQASRISNPQIGPDGTLFIQNLRVPETLFDHVYGFHKFAPDRNSARSEKSLWKQLQEYDDARARPEVPMGPSGPGRGRDATSRRHGAQDPSLLSTSVSSRRPSILGRASGLPSEYRSDPDRLQVPQGRPKPLDDSALVSKAMPARPPRFGRQISLGLRGFGIAAPKAATAEISVETVGASKTALPARMAPARPTQRPNSPQKTTVGSPSSTHGRVSPLSFGRGPQSPLDTPTPSRPISIRSQQRSVDSSSTLTPGSSTLRPDHLLEARHSDAIRAQDAQKVNTSKLRAGLPSAPTLSPKTALSPWLTELNPSNPDYGNIDMTMLYSRWQHVFPRPSDMQVQKWKSLCSPAAVPLTTEYFPSQKDLDEKYECQPYNVGQDLDDDLAEEHKTRDEMLREMISLRLSQGFQIVVPEALAKSFAHPVFKPTDVFCSGSVLEDGTSVFMSVGNMIHQLSCANGSEIEVNIFVRKPMDKAQQLDDGPAVYKPAIRTLYDKAYETGQFGLFAQKPERNWSFIDSFIAGHNDEMTEHLRFWRARFVLIPVHARHSSFPRQSGDSDEEIRIEGIRKLAQTWQKNRYVPPNERRYQSVNSRRRKDMNPLDIVYKTDDPSVVIAAELETLPLFEGLEGASRKGQLVRSREQFQKKNFSLAALAEAIQQPIENGGVRMQNRRWHLRLHYNCFIGSDMTSWLLENFEDLEDREEAEELGNRLMVSEEDRQKDRDGGREQRRETGGLFVHVERRHLFRDGQYFYQISSDFAKPHPPSWFNARRNHQPSAPSTPLAEQMTRDTSRTSLARPMSIHDDNDSTTSGTTTPTAPQPAPGVKRPKVVLSKSIKYDVDHRKRSYRPEIVELHYDRLHNPDNCYHIRIDWMNVTAKLIEDAIENWAREAQPYGLRLVEVPIAEACAITDINPFRRPYLIQLALPPPDQQPLTYFDPNSFVPQTQPGRHFYQKAILRKFDFVLDVEAASNFPTSNVDVSYSWGRPDFKYTQYIHRTGVVLAQITDDGSLLILANRLYSNRAAAARERELQKDLRTTTDRSASGGGVPPRTPFGLDPTPIASPSFKPAFLLSPALRPSLPPTPSPGPFTPKPSAGGAGGGGNPFAPPINLTIPSPPEPELIKSELEAFCADKPALDAFYREQQLASSTATAAASASAGQARSAGPTPRFGPLAGVGVGTLDTNIPVLGLPPAVLAAAGGGGGASSFNPRAASGSAGGLMASSQMFARRGSAADVMMGLRMTSISGGPGGGGGGGGGGGNVNGSGNGGGGGGGGG
ncbi:putative vacuolar membrane-associated protein IML1 [Podospora conica]|nr:putative vacuolar membrane-associated protein IML1 [Schizothecium conicum]